MAKRQTTWKTKGMNRDLSVSAFNPEFAFENINLRLSTNEGSTLMSWVNEKGTKRIEIYQLNSDGTPSSTKMSITGTPVGTAILNHKLVIFTVFTDVDYIYSLEYIDEDKTQMGGKVLYSGSLNLDIQHPLETLASYESENIQKVYWVDGKNQPRVINIAADNKSKSNTAFNFVRELRLRETVTVQKQLGASGMFAPGVIQYAFTYYDKYMQETNIFYTTPLYYISNADRGASPEDKVENAFKITVNNIDKNFDFLRIYSIQRTSINATPICKRIQDIDIKGLPSEQTSASYTDTGFSGDSIDPMELLYKGGVEISAETLEQKDGTLFLGNINLISEINEAELETIVGTDSISVADSTRTFTANAVSSGNYQYANQLTSFSSGKSVPCGGFKGGDYYRLGVQFQYKTGKWSRPIHVKDHQVSLTARPVSSGESITVPTITATLPSNIASQLINAGYKKVRAVVVFPEMQDRYTVCQGVVNPTVYTKNQRETDKNLYAQASWFFRPSVSSTSSPTGVGTVSPKSDSTLDYTFNTITYNPQNMRSVEIQGSYETNNKFNVDRGCLTFNSPDVEFDDHLSVMDFSGLKCTQVGNVEFTNTLSDIDIQTETPTVSNSGSGFIHKSFADTGSYGIVSGLFYEDYIIDDWSDSIGKDDEEKSPFKWMVFTWNKTGSLNNDFNRPVDKGIQSAKLKKKVISNLRYATTAYSQGSSVNFTENPQLYSSNEPTILKLASNTIYQGNIDTLLIPDHAESSYFCHDANDWKARSINTTFTSTKWWRTFSQSEESSENEGIYKWANPKWERKEGHFGDYYVDLVFKKEPVRMKYKSTPHLVFLVSRTTDLSWNTNKLPLVDIVKSNLDTNLIFGGTTKDAFKENTWVPCGEPEILSSSGNTFRYDYGDTYYQRWDCLKTYPFTREDINQVVEIGSFMLETRVNIDGRYDRNRGQINNLNMSPVNFNLFNPVYSQIDNFFSYKILDDDAYKLNKYPNQVTWSKTKNNGAEVDLWTNITLASVLELDGDKGSLNSIQRFNNQLIAFQDTGISQIMYNDNVLIESSQGVPIEIASSNKVGGKDYRSNTVGCSNKWSIVNTPMGIYFMDSHDKSIYLFNGQLTNLSLIKGMNTWTKKVIPSPEIKWDIDKFNNFVTYYDKKNQDILFILDDVCLAYSERLGAFTSFYDYSRTPFFCNLDDTGIWIRGNQSCELWKHQAGEYCNFFGTSKPYSMTLICNQEPQSDKIFTNLEFRANVEGDGILSEFTDVDTFDESFDYTFHPDGRIRQRFKFFTPFDSLEAWDEYQHGIARLSQKDGRGTMQHHLPDSTAHLNRKFRIWRCDVPRNNYPMPTTDEETQRELELGIYRKIRKPQDRMRNPWMYFQLSKNAGDTNRKTEIHDIVMTYFV